ncbi:tRNA preQ1(34) S-adenosylmethionine ribosyltransferase-isomerase QueA [Buchnera aphidicola (Mindarus keteleerifoliae)]|uniref:tRNA preQ1(34) S-adenosylmethionine ribosyltransferase-isomerase QueA n=1 Tax=Buchnera aphidicola TaxID=9 RepID=UPI0031B6EA5F
MYCFSDFDFFLPKHLIPYYPLESRSESRLLIVDGKDGNIKHAFFKNIVDHFNPNDLLVFNDTKVIPARIFGIKKKTGGKIEIFIIKIITNNKVVAKIKSSNSCKVGDIFILGEKKNFSCSIISIKKKFFEIKFHNVEKIMNFLYRLGHMPLPPYIHRKDNIQDHVSYQTVYANHLGSVAAPTAGLHFDNDLLKKLKKRKVQFAFITLHIGLGTFQPIKNNNLKSHIMHSEHFRVNSKVLKEILECKKRGNRVIAVGTSTLRALESIQSKKKNDSSSFKKTNIFIYPGYNHTIADGLITNFHFPNSTLILLVASFLGCKNTINVYKEAIKKNYRFLSYGDSMFITNKKRNEKKNVFLFK